MTKITKPCNNKNNQTHTQQKESGNLIYPNSFLFLFLSLFLIPLFHLLIRPDHPITAHALGVVEHGVGDFQINLI